MAGALGVCVAAIYYVMTLRVTQRNLAVTLETRKLQFVLNTAQQLLSEEGFRRGGELLNMEWSDYDDFEKKYGSDFNLDNYAKRNSTNYTYNSLGYLLRENLIDAEVLYGFLEIIPTFLWSKFEDQIKESRRRYMGKDNHRDFEFLAKEMLRIKLIRDPEYKLPEAFIKYIPTK
jgi:hypothetical protein